MPKAYVPIPVAVAAEIGREYGKAMVVCLAYDEEFDLVHTTTWGRTAEQTVFAARWGDQLATQTGCDLADKRTHEDFRSEEEAARNAALVVELRARVTELDEIAQQICNSFSADGESNSRTADLSIIDIRGMAASLIQRA